MYRVRHWSVRHARGLNAFYRGFEALLVRLGGLFGAIGYDRVERPVAFVERNVKGLLFDCRMCGQCVLSSTGMSCPMNCPEDFAQRPLRRRARGRPLRSQAGDEMRMGRSLPRQPAHRRRHRGDDARFNSPSTSACRGVPRGCAVVREKSGAAVRFDDEPVPGYPLPILAGAYLAGPIGARAARRLVRRHDANSRRRTLPIPRMSTRAPACSTATSMRSTRPTAAARTATCRASPSARC